MMKMPFKIGDKLKCIDPGNEDLTLNKIYIAQSNTFEYQKIVNFITIIRDMGHYGNNDCERFVKIKTKKFHR